MHVGSLNRCIDDNILGVNKARVLDLDHECMNVAESRFSASCHLDNRQYRKRGSDMNHERLVGSARLVRDVDCDGEILLASGIRRCDDDQCVSGHHEGTEGVGISAGALPILG